MGQPRDGGGPFPAADAAKVARISNELRDALAADPPPSVTGTLSFAYALDYCALILLPDSAQWLQSGLLASLLENYNWPPWQDVQDHAASRVAWTLVFDTQCQHLSGANEC